MLSEIKLHSRAKHKNICELERAFEDDDNVYMLLEVCSNGVFPFRLRTCSSSSAVARN